MKINKNNIKLKKLLLPIIIVILAITIGIILNISFKEEKSSVKANTNNITVDEVVTVKDNITIEINSSLPEIKDYYIDESYFLGEETISYFQDNEKVIPDLTKTGTYDVIIYALEEYQSTLTIEDKTSPTITTKDLSIKSGATYSAYDFISTYKDNSNSTNYTATIVEEENQNITDSGTYYFNISVCDESNNCIEEEVKLIITKSSSSSSSSSSTTTTTKKEIIKTVNYSYGVKEITYQNVKYQTDSSGNTKEVSRSASITEMDYSGYNGTVKTMLSEATSVYNSSESVRTGILKCTNEYREAAGVGNLTIDKDLSIMATIRAMELAYSNTFAHKRPDGRTWYTIWSEYGLSYTYIGENLAYGYSTVSGTCNGWRNSEDHYKNMIDENFNKIGIGKYTFNNKTYWVQLFSE